MNGIFSLITIFVLLPVLYYDFLYYKIPNFIPVTIIALYFVRFFWVDVHLTQSFITTLLVFNALALLVTYLGHMGEGDFKLMFALSPWIYEANLKTFLLGFFSASITACFPTIKKVVFFMVF